MTGFLAWALAGLLLAAAGVSIASVGLLLLPVAAVVTVLVARRWPPGPASAGLLAGAGVVLLGVGLLNARGSRCPREAGSCGIDPLPWFVAGAFAVVAGFVAYAVARRRSQSERTSSRVRTR